MRNLSFRKHQEWRYHKKVENILDIWDTGKWGHAWLPEERQRFIQHAYHTRKACSRACCGNPRKWHNEKTYQEKKADIEFEEMLKEDKC